MDVVPLMSLVIQVPAGPGVLHAKKTAVNTLTFNMLGADVIIHCSTTFKSDINSLNRNILNSLYNNSFQTPETGFVKSFKGFPTLLKLGFLKVSKGFQRTETTFLKGF